MKVKLYVKIFRKEEIKYLPIKKKSWFSPKKPEWGHYGSQTVLDSVYSKVIDVPYLTSAPERIYASESPINPSIFVLIISSSGLPEYWIQEGIVHSTKEGRELIEQEFVENGWTREKIKC